jgi:DNA-binding response OmpR family regulator
MPETSPKILVADDDQEIRTIVRAKLAAMRCEVLIAKDGEEALATALAESPDLILLDVMMPRLNGWEVIQHLRKKPEFGKTAIIMVTGIGETANDATAPLFGADDHINKPFELSELEFKVRRALSAKRRETRKKPEEEAAEG